MAFCFQTSKCQKTAHRDMQLLVSSQLEAGMEEVLDEMVGPGMMQKGKTWMQGGNIRQQAGQGTPPGDGVCTVCTIRYYEFMTQIKSASPLLNAFL